MNLCSDSPGVPLLCCASPPSHRRALVALKAVSSALHCSNTLALDCVSRWRSVMASFNSKCAIVQPCSVQSSQQTGCNSCSCEPAIKETRTSSMRGRCTTPTADNSSGTVRNEHSVCIPSLWQFRRLFCAKERETDLRIGSSIVT